MRSTLFGHGSAASPERFSLPNPQVLAVRLGPEAGDTVLARKGSMVAYQGAVEFDGWYRTDLERRAAAATGEALDLMSCRGVGVVYLARLAQEIHTLDTSYGGLVVSGAYVLALDPWLTWDVVAVDHLHVIPGVGSYNLEIRGRGRVALITSGKPLVLQSRHGHSVCADADAVIAWSPGLHTRMEAQAVPSERVWRRRGGTGEGWNMSFTGDGYVVVQPTEAAPPTSLVPQGGPLGMGPQGYRGNTWGS